MNDLPTIDEIAQRAFGKLADELTPEELDEILEALRIAERARNAPSRGSESCL